MVVFGHGSSVSEEHPKAALRYADAHITRLATDLNLNRTPVASSKPLNEMETRELLNRTRIWINCYNLDRSTSSWLGKSATINNNDYIAQHCDSWYNSSEFNMKNFDIQLVAYNSELRLMGEFRASIVGNKDHPSGLKKVRVSSYVHCEMNAYFARITRTWISMFLHQRRTRNFQIYLASGPRDARKRRIPTVSISL